MLKYCEHCGAANDDQDAKCRECGMELTKKADAGKTPPPGGRVDNSAGYDANGYDPRWSSGRSTGGPDYRSTAYGNTYIGKRRSGVNTVLLSIVTCGIYAIYWIYATMEEINNANNEKRFNSGVMILVSILCAPIMFYTLYRIDKEVAKLCAIEGIEYEEKFIFWLLLSLLCGIGSIVAMVQTCGTMNAIWKSRYERAVRR